jgi:hypothetical protein
LDKIFNVYLAKCNVIGGRSTMLGLPATDYALLDALEKAQLSEKDEYYYEIDEYYGFKFLAPFLSEDDSIFEVNALARQLSTLNHRQSIAFEGLVQMAVDRRADPFGIAQLIDLAYSADCCHVVDGALTDAQVGRFYAENGFVPKVSELPDNVFEMLDFKQIGRQIRKDEGGVLTQHGYVVQHTELKQVYDTLDLQPHKPDYIFRLLLSNHERDDLTPVPLELPATKQQMEQVQRALEAPDWLGVQIVSLDGALPMLDTDTFYADEIDQMNELAQRVQQLDADGKLNRYKAILTATDCHDMNAAIALADTVDDYRLSVNIRSAEDVASEALSGCVDLQAAEILKKHLDLYACGTDIMEQDHSTLTGYGLLERVDGQPILAIDARQEPGGMQMM